MVSASSFNIEVQCSHRRGGHRRSTLFLKSVTVLCVCSWPACLDAWKMEHRSVDGGRRNMDARFLLTQMRPMRGFFRMPKMTSSGRCCPDISPLQVAPMKFMNRQVIVAGFLALRVRSPTRTLWMTGMKRMTFALCVCRLKSEQGRLG